MEIAEDDEPMDAEEERKDDDDDNWVFTLACL